MQLNNMDCSSRSIHLERETDLGDDLSHDSHSDDDMRECDSVDGDHNPVRPRHLNISATNRAVGVGEMNFVSGGAVGVGVGGRSPDQQTEMQMSHHHQFPPNHPLNALGNFMNIGGLHGIPNLPHNDVLEKLKMQVRDINVGLMEQDYAAAAAHAAAFGSNVLPAPINTAFSLPPTSSMGSFASHAAQKHRDTLASNGGSANAQSSKHAIAATLSNGSSGIAIANNGSNNNSAGGNSFSFVSPTAPSTKDVNPASNSSTSSEASNSSQQNNGWSFEEQYKQLRQLYEINNDPKRKEFLDDLFSFMQKRGTPINRLPIMAKSVLDLYELYNLVIARGGLVDVINKKLWQEIIKGLNLPSSITSAAFTLRTQYMKYLYPYECEKKNLSTPAELTAAVEGNRREGRRSSYGQYEAIHNQMQMPQMSRQTMQQMSPLALVTHAAAANNQQAAQAAAAAAAAHHRLMAPSFGQVPNLVTHEIEQRMMEYLKLIQAKKEQNAAAAGGLTAAGVAGNITGAGMGGLLSAAHLQQQQQQQQKHQQRQRSQSPEISTREALNALEMSRVALWQMYHNNTSPPASVNTSPQGLGLGNGNVTALGASGISNDTEPQREALNLSDSPPHHLNNMIKREREHEPSVERDDFQQQAPPTKRMNNNAAFQVSGFPASFYLPAAAAAAAANFHRANAHDSDVEHDEENDDEEGEHNTTNNSSMHEEEEHEQNMAMHLQNGHHNIHHHQQQLHFNQQQQQPEREHKRSSNGGQQHDKSDDSAIENSPSTSASAGNGHISPISTKKLHLSKSILSNCNDMDMPAENVGAALNALQTLNLLSSMQFHVARSGTGINGQQQLVVNLELNGIKYSGVLSASASAAAPAATESSIETAAALQTAATETTTPGVAHNNISIDNENSNDVPLIDNEDDAMDASDDDEPQHEHAVVVATTIAKQTTATGSEIEAEHSPSSTKAATMPDAHTNGSSSNAITLKDVLITATTT